MLSSYAILPGRRVREFQTEQTQPQRISRVLLCEDEVDQGWFVDDAVGHIWFEKGENLVPPQRRKMHYFGFLLS